MESQSGPFEVDTDMTAEEAFHRKSILPTESVIANLVLLAGGLAAVLFYCKMQDHRLIEKEVLFLAGHDSLTGIPNRQWLAAKVVGTMQQ